MNEKFFFERLFPVLLTGFLLRFDQKSIICFTDQSKASDSFISKPKSFEMINEVFIPIKDLKKHIKEK